MANTDSKRKQAELERRDKLSSSWQGVVPLLLTRCTKHQGII